MPDVKTEFLFEVTFDLDRTQTQELPATPRGHRRVLPVTGGTFAGPRLKGTVLPGGGDWLLVRPDGTREIDVRTTLRTDDGALIYVTYRGLIHSSPEVAERMARGEAVAPSEYYFRTAPFFETGSKTYDWLNHLLAVGIGRRTETGVTYQVYAIL